MKRLIRVTAAANYLGLSPDTLKRWAKHKMCPSLKSPFGQLYWSQEMLDDIRNNMLNITEDEYDDAENENAPNDLREPSRV